MQRRKFIAGALLMGALPYVSFANATKKTEGAAPAATKTKDGVVITNDNFIHADSIRAYLKELDKAGKVNVIRPGKRPYHSRYTRCNSYEQRHTLYPYHFRL